jgi:hypothetical protein
MIIGLCGFKGSGKSVVAKYLEENHGFKRVNFKDCLIAEMRYNLPDTLKALSQWHSLTIDELFDIKPLVMRELMQNYGTDIRRKDKDSYWVDRWLERVKEVGGNIVTDDVRFFNELSAITEQDGVLIRVKRDDITTGGTHVSETEQQKFVEDFTIEATVGDHNGVYKQVESILETIKSNVD